MRSLGGENILSSGGVTLEGVKLIPAAFYDRMTKGQLKDDDVLINKDGAQTGKVGWYHATGPDPACINEHLFLLRGVPNRISQGYLYYTLLSEAGQNQIRMQITGSAQPGLKSGFVKGVVAEIPEAPTEQSKVVEILSTVDRAIVQTEALIVKQRRIMTGLLQDLLTRGVDEHGNLRSERTHEFKDSPLGRIPVEWDLDTLSSVLSRAPKNGYSPVASDQWNGLYMLGLGCLTPDGFTPAQLKYAPLADRARQGAMLSPGDFLMSRSNTRELVGLVGIFRDIGEPCIYPDLMVRLYFKETVSAEFMEMIFRSATVRRQLESEATGTSGSMVKINATIIRHCAFARPDFEEQERLLARYNAQRRLLQDLRHARVKLASVKAGLMEDLLTGERRVTALLTRT